MEADRILGELTDFVCSARESSLSDEVLEAATVRVFDTLGCAFGGYDTEPARIARELAHRQPVHPGARVLGLDTPTSPDLAAFANAVAARYQDFNDVNKSFLAGGHPSDTIPAILAAAESQHLSGAEALMGVVVAYQGFGAISVRLREAGWDGGLLVSIGVAMGVAAMLRMPPAQVRHAISLAVVPNVPLRVTRRGEMQMWKVCASAAANRSALTATTLAAMGLTGPARPFEGPHGLCEQCTGDIDLQLDPDQHGYRVMQSDIKQFPSCGATQAVLATLLDMTEGLTADEVESLDIRTHWDTWFETGSEPARWDPRNRATADHSMPYLAALVIHHREVTPRSYSDELLYDPQLRAFMRRVTISEDPELTALRPARTVSDLTVTLTDGRVLRARTGVPRGDHRNPLSVPELERKFRGMASALVPEQRLTDLMDALWNLRRTPDVSEVVGAWADAVVPRHG